MNRNKLYLVSLLAFLSGYVWLGVAYKTTPSMGDSNVQVCLFKHVTNIPCPSCGSTRSILSLLKGDVVGSFYWNPVGVLLFIIMFISPLWILFDVFNKKETLYSFYKKAELFLKQKWVAIPAIVLVLTNWIWNISKGL
jgi:hypothetical protein